MTEEQRQQAAVFRYGIISPVIHNSGIGQNEYFRRISDQEFKVPWKKGPTRYSISTMKSWLSRYRQYGFNGLKPETRTDAGISRVISESTQATIKSLIQEYPAISSAGFYRVLCQKGVISQADFSEATLRNYLKRNGFFKPIREIEARRKFEAPEVNHIWITDFMHGPYVYDNLNHNRKRKTYLCAIIDDHTRYIVGARFFFNENTQALASILKASLLQHGIPKILYCDNGSSFISDYLRAACGRVGIALIHSKPRTPQGRGKIERFFRTCQTSFLDALPINSFDTISELESLFQDWLNSGYHLQTHSGIQTSPKSRLIYALERTMIRRLDNHLLDEALFISRTRRVNNDNTISIEKILYEVPPQFTGYTIEVRSPIDQPSKVFLFHKDTNLGELKRVHIAENAALPAHTIKFTTISETEDIPYV